MHIILLIVLFAGTLCIIFQRQIVDFLFRFCKLGKLFDKLDTCFLSKQEKEHSRQEAFFRQASPEELQTEWNSILTRCAGKYTNAYSIPQNLEECLSNELKLFFKEYDYLNIGGANILDVKALKRITLGKADYIVIGGDDQEESLFVIKVDAHSATSQIFMIDSTLDNPENLTVNTASENSYRSIRNFVCTMALYLGQTDSQS